MTDDRILPEGERLRRAVQWLGEQPVVDRDRLVEACRRFDLAPPQEQFLFRHFLKSLSG